MTGKCGFEKKITYRLGSSAVLRLVRLLTEFRAESDGRDSYHNRSGNRGNNHEAGKRQNGNQRTEC